MKHDVKDIGRLRVAIITGFQAFDSRGKGQPDLIRRFSDILGPSSYNLFVIGGYTLLDGKKIPSEKDGKNPSMIVTALKYIPYGEVGTFIRLAQIINKVDIVIFFLSNPLILPTLLAKAARKKSLFVITGLMSREVRIKINNGIASIISANMFKMLETTCMMLVDRVAVESPSILHFHGMDKYSRKAVVFGANYVNTSFFKQTSSLSSREDIVGYMGRLSAEKGIMDFVGAIPHVLTSRGNIRFLIVGDGPLRHDIEREIKRSKLESKVTLAGYVPREECPYYLNQFKLLVSPSHTEGLPALIQEAMACGTPVLATPVGGIPDLIKDTETGFIIECNSHEIIAENIVRALSHPGLDRITRNASDLIHREYNYETSVRKYMKVLTELSMEKRGAIERVSIPRH
jgi:glycosyltransferase involved in cell wall biosynthesis